MQHAVSWRPRDHVVEGDVGLEEILGAAACGHHPVELLPELIDHVAVAAVRSNRRSLGFEHPPHLEQFEHRPPAEQVRCRQSRLEEFVRLEARDIGSVPWRTLSTPASESAHTASRSEFRDTPSLSARSARTATALLGPRRPMQ